MRAIIFAASKEATLPDKLDTENSIIICADGGTALACKMGIMPDYVIGDLDSYKGDIPKSAELIKLNPDKDDTDLEAACNLAIDKGCSEIIILGALGGRADHLMGNFAVLLNLELRGINACLIDSNTTVNVKAAESTIEFKNGVGCTLSVIPFCCESAVVSSSGVKYPLTHGKMLCDKTLGISNVITENSAVFNIESGNLLFIKSTHVD